MNKSKWCTTVLSSVDDDVGPFRFGGAVEIHALQEFNK